MIAKKHPRLSDQPTTCIGSLCLAPRAPLPSRYCPAPAKPLV